MEGKYEMPPHDFDFSHPSFPGESRGKVNLSIKIISKSFADENPVGKKIYFFKRY